MRCPYCGYEITPCTEFMPCKISMPIGNILRLPDRTFILYKTDYSGNGFFRRNVNEHMDMIWHQAAMPFKKLLADEKQVLMGVEPKPWPGLPAPNKVERIKAWSPDEAKPQLMARFSELSI